MNQEICTCGHSYSDHETVFTGVDQWDDQCQKCNCKLFSRGKSIVQEWKDNPKTELTDKQRIQILTSERDFFKKLVQQREGLIQKISEFLKNITCCECKGQGYITTYTNGIARIPCKFCLDRYDILRQCPTDKKI